MTKLLEKAIAQARKLPQKEQDALAAVLLTMTDQGAGIEPLDDDAREPPFARALSRRAGANLHRTTISRRSGNASAYESATRRVRVVTFVQLSLISNE